MKKAKAFFLAALLMIAPCFAKAGELSNEEILFFKERTAEWEAEFGQSETWNYLTIGMFCRIYQNYPDAEWEVITAILPTLPDIRLHTSCADAVAIAKEFLIGYDARITEHYLAALAMGTRFLNLSTYTDSTSTAYCDRMWIVKFYERMSSGEYLMRCDCYVDAETGKVFMIDLNLNGKNLQDFDDYQVIEIE